MKRILCFAVFAMLAAPARAEAIEEADPARIVAEPEAYAGRAVTVAVNFLKIDNGRDPWEEQGDLKTARVIKFTASSLGGMKCYADRTPRNMDALTGLKKGGKLILSGAVRRYRPAVKATYDVKGGRRGVMREDESKEYGQALYVFMVESIARGTNR
jgi:hypothetical protein